MEQRERQRQREGEDGRLAGFHPFYGFVDLTPSLVPPASLPPCHPEGYMATLTMLVWVECVCELRSETYGQTSSLCQHCRHSFVSPLGAPYSHCLVPHPTPLSLSLSLKG